MPEITARVSGPLSPISTKVGRWRGSALMAKPKSINWTIGRPIIMPKVTRSRRIWMNSL